MHHLMMVQWWQSADDFFFVGGSWVWIPKIGIRESGDITFYAGRACALPDNGPAVEAGEVGGGMSPRCILASTLLPT